jgi:hypothetical protein
MTKTFALFDGETILYKSKNYRELAKQRDAINFYTKRKTYVGVWLGRVKIEGV